MTETTPEIGPLQVTLSPTDREVFTRDTTPAIGTYVTWEVDVGTPPIRILTETSKRARAKLALQPIVLTSIQGAASQAAPAANTTIVSSGPVPPGIYTLNWTVELAGTVAAGTDNDNFKVVQGATVLLSSVNPAVVGSYPQDPITVQVGPAGLATSFQIKNIGAATAGSTYRAQITLTPVSEANLPQVTINRKSDPLTIPIPAGFIMTGYNPNLKIESSDEVWVLNTGPTNCFVSVLEERYQD